MDTRSDPCEESDMSVFDESMSRRTFAKSTAAVSAGVMLGVPAASAVMAQDATPVGDAGPGLPPRGIDGRCRRALESPISRFRG